MPGTADQATFPVCETADLTVTLHWEPDGSGLRGSAIARVHGPAQPACYPGRPGDLTSSWFGLIE
jgi:hypothetical protein